MTAQRQFGRIAKTCVFKTFRRWPPTHVSDASEAKHEGAQLLDITALPAILILEIRLRNYGRSGYRKRLSRTVMGEFRAKQTGNAG